MNGFEKRLKLAANGLRRVIFTHSGDPQSHERLG
jgi:hypothetical protein